MLSTVSTQIMRTSLETDKSSWPETWQAAYRVLEQSIAPHQLQTWIQPLSFIELQPTDKGMRAKVMAPNDFSGNWVRDHYRAQIEAALTQVIGVAVELQMSVYDGPEQKFEPYEAPVETPRANPPYSGDHAPSSGVVISSGSRHPGGDSALDSRYTLESFVVGASNQFAYASAVAVSEHPARQYNPLFLYSPPGLGKTHLLHAIGNHMISKNPKARGLLVGRAIRK
jgi:chromosomal replication initiator protein